MKRYLAAILVGLLTVAAMAIGQVSTNPTRTGVGSASGSISVGGTVTGGSANQVLYVDGSGNLAGASTFASDGAKLTLSTNGSTGGLSIGGAPLTFYYDSVTGWGRIIAPSGASMGVTSTLFAYSPTGDPATTHTALFNSAGVLLSGATPCITWQTASPGYVPYASVCGDSANDYIYIANATLQLVGNATAVAALITADKSVRWASGGNNTGIMDHESVDGEYIWKNATYAALNKIDKKGRRIIGGVTPSMGACGTNPSVTGHDESMLVTVGTGGVATSCAVSFGATWPSTPTCTAQNDTDRVAYSMVTSTTVLTITATAAFTAGSKFHVHCRG